MKALPILPPNSITQSTPPQDSPILTLGNQDRRVFDYLLDTGIVWLEDNTRTERLMRILSQRANSVSTVGHTTTYDLPCGLVMARFSLYEAEYCFTFQG